MADTKEHKNNFQNLNNSFCTSLLDGATPSTEVITPEWELERSIASNPNYDLEERLEAYENIIDSEIGDTSMTRARNIERDVGLRQLFLKFVIVCMPCFLFFLLLKAIFRIPLSRRVYLGRMI